MNWLDGSFPWSVVVADPLGGYTIYSIDESGNLSMFGPHWKRPRRTASELKEGRPRSTLSPHPSRLGSPERARRIAEAVQHFAERWEACCHACTPSTADTLYGTFRGLTGDFAHANAKAIRFEKGKERPWKEAHDASKEGQD